MSCFALDELRFKGRWELQGNISQVLSHASPSSAQTLNVSRMFHPSLNVTDVLIRSIDGISVFFSLVRHRSLQSPAVIPAPTQYSLAMTRDFLSFATCAENRTWVELRPLLVEQAAFTGGACTRMPFSFITRLSARD